MPVVMGAVCPHPPLMIPAVGRGSEKQVEKTRKAIGEVGRQILANQVERLVWITPHGPVFGDGLAFNGLNEVSGDMGQFQAGQVKFKLTSDLTAVKAICEAADAHGITTVILDPPKAAAYGVNLALDHGIMAPLWHLQQTGVNLPVVIIYMGLLAYEDLYYFGLALQEALAKLDGRTAVIASSDLSHRLTSEAPAGYHPDGAIFDQYMKENLTHPDKLLRLDYRMIENAGECGFRPIMMLLGALEGCKLEEKVLAYEGPFGVGYLTAAYQVIGADPERTFYPALERQRKERNLRRQQQESFLPSLARQSIRQYLDQKSLLDWRELKIPAEFQKAAGAFVSLKKNGHLRGCIGTVSAQAPNVAAEVIYNAVQAATQDQRFYPVQKSELDELSISVDVLGMAEPIAGSEELDPSRYGVIVQSGFKSGLLLPDLEGVDTVEEQIRIACQKAGIESGGQITLQRFEVSRYY